MGADLVMDTWSSLKCWAMTGWLHRRASVLDVADGSHANRHPGHQHFEMTEPLRIFLGVLVAVGLLGGGSGCTRGPRRPRNVVFVVVDTLRADHLGTYGYDRPTSPNIDALASSGKRFERAYSTAPWTKPSIASMITGFYPSALGIDGIFSPLPDSAETLAEILGRHGYQTAGVVSHVMLSKNAGTGYGQGYDVYLESEARGYSYVSTDGVTDQALGVLDQLTETDQPFLLFVHYFDPHFNYLDHPSVDFAPTRSTNLDGSESLRVLRERVKDLAPEDVAFIRSRYDEEIRITDAGIGRLMEALTEKGLDDDSVVIFTSDHGEEFGEQGWIGHLRSLHEQVVRIPLIVRVPGSQAVRGSEPGVVSLSGLVPTILELVGIEFEEDSFQGRSFADRFRKNAPARESSAFVELDFPLQDPRISPIDLHRRAVVGERFKLILDKDKGTSQLYDLSLDPREATDIALREPELVQRLSSELRDWSRAVGTQESSGESEADMATLEALQELGYVELVEPTEPKVPAVTD